MDAGNNEARMEPAKGIRVGRHDLAISTIDPRHERFHRSLGEFAHVLTGSHLCHTVAAFLRKRFRSTAIFGILVWFLVSQSGKEQVVRLLIGGICCSAVGGTLVGGFVTMNICAIVVIVQCYRGGVVTFRNPLEIVSEKVGGRSSRQEEL